MATSSTWRDFAPSIWSAARNSCAISGQSLVHTGSRNVSRTTLPRRLARLTWLPFWSVSWNDGAAKFSGALLPSIARAMIGSAFGFAWASAAGATPMMIITMAQAASTARVLTDPNDRARPVGWSRARQPAAAGGDPAAAVPAAGTAAVAAAGTRVTAR